MATYEWKGGTSDFCNPNNWHVPQPKRRWYRRLWAWLTREAPPKVIRPIPQPDDVIVINGCDGGMEIPKEFQASVRAMYEFGIRPVTEDK